MKIDFIILCFSYMLLPNIWLNNKMLHVISFVTFLGTYVKF